MRNRLDSVASPKASGKSTGAIRAAGRSNNQSSTQRKLPLQGNKHASSLHPTSAKRTRTDTGQSVDSMMAQKLAYHRE